MKVFNWNGQEDILALARDEAVQAGENARLALELDEADDEFVRPGGAVFRPERALDDVFAAPKAPGKPRVRASPASVAPRAGQANRRELAEDPAGRASESGRPAREGRREP